MQLRNFAEKAEDKVHLHLRKMRFKTSRTENWHTSKGPYMGKKNFNENNVQSNIYVTGQN